MSPIPPPAFLTPTLSLLPSPKTPPPHLQKTPPPRAITISPDAIPAPPPLTKPSPPPPVQTHRLTILSTTTPFNPPLSQITHHIRAANGILHPPRPLSPTVIEARVTLPTHIPIDPLRTALHISGRPAGVDVILQEDSVVRERKRLAVFDLDSTLIAQETIDELAAQVNLETQVKAITERAMNGEIGFRDALKQRVALLEGLAVTALDGVKERVKFTEGAHRLIRTLNALGCRTAVVSGGFHFLADHVRDELGLDYSFANRLEVGEGGLLTGRTVGEIVDAEYKDSTLKRLAAELGLRREQVLAVGDGSNDLLMMRSAGTGVAFNAKPIVQDRAKCRVNQPSLANVLYLLGLSDDDIVGLVGDGC